MLEIPQTFPFTPVDSSIMLPSMNPTMSPLLLLFVTFSHAWDSSLYTSSPPVYPSPNTTGIAWEDAFIKAQSLVSNLTLEEKVMVVTGTPGPCVGNIPSIPRVGFGGLCLQDGKQLETILPSLK